MDKYIKKKDLLKAFPKAEADVFENCRNCTCLDSEQIEDIIKSIPAADVVEQKVLDQVYWERDTALHQLAEIGKGLGEKMDDVVERKHGKWEKHNDGIMIWWDCSECHHDAWYDEDDLYNFCPNCGADMRGEDDV